MPALGVPAWFDTRSVELTMPMKVGSEAMEIAAIPRLNQVAVLSGPI